MQPRIRVLVVDDSVVIRRILSDVIAADSSFELAGFAANGRIALNMLDRVSPDIITLDVEMPELDGLETLRAIREQHRRLPVIMFSTLTERGAQSTIEALSLGASDYVTKPANVGSFGAARQQIQELLIPKMKALCGAGEAAPRQRPAPLSAPPANTLRRQPASTTPIQVVAVGCSTGGPNALADLLAPLPANFPAPIVVTQHMPPVFTRFLAQRLKNHCRLQVQEAVDGSTLHAGEVWIAPGDFHMRLLRGKQAVQIELDQAPPENSCRPSVDVLFRSVAAACYGPSVLAVILTGMGQDGLRGCEQLAAHGAQILVQDEASSVVWGMPGAVARAGLAQSIVSLPNLAGEIMRRVQAGAPEHAAEAASR